jgi:hypothetical protein
LDDDHRDVNDSATRSAKTPLVSVRGRAVPFPLSVILWIPMVAAFLIATPLSIPVTKVWQAIKRRQERKFVTEMKSANRLVSWTEARSYIENGNGFLISEHFSLKGPTRLWWTPDDIPAVSPHRYLFETNSDPFNSINSEFELWCRSRYSDPRSGGAHLVELPDVDRDGIRQSLTKVSNEHRLIHVWRASRSDEGRTTAS